MEEVNAVLESLRATNFDIYLGLLNQCSSYLQKRISDGTINTNGIPEARNELERATENMEKQEYIKKIITKIGEPKRLTGKYERYGWRPFGYKGVFVREGTVDKVYDKTWDLYKEQESRKGRTLGEALELYIKDKRDVKGNTCQKYRNNIKMFLERFLDKPLHLLTALEIETEYQTMLELKKPHRTTVNGFRSTLKHVLKHVKKHYGQELLFDISELMEDLLENTNKKNYRNKQKPWNFDDPFDRYTPNQMSLFVMEALRRNNLKSLAAAVLFFTGLRASEICGAMKEDFDFENHVIHVRHAALEDKTSNTYYIGSPKENKERVVVYPDVMDGILQRVMELNVGETEFMFPDKTGKIGVGWMRRRQLDNEIASICKAVGMERKSAHDIRRTYDSMLDEAGLSSSLRHLLVGHQLTGIDAHYLRDAHTLADVRCLVNKAFEGIVI